MRCVTNLTTTRACVVRVIMADDEQGDMEAQLADSLADQREALSSLEETLAAGFDVDEDLVKMRDALAVSVREAEAGSSRCCSPRS
jgi:ParB-like chromosome segregation protein Spo0J